MHIGMSEDQQNERQGGHMPANSDCKIVNSDPAKFQFHKQWTNYSQDNIIHLLCMEKISVIFHWGVLLVQTHKI